MSPQGEMCKDKWTYMYSFTTKLDYFAAEKKDMTYWIFLI